MTERTLTRRELFDLVWQTSMVKLAKEFGLSDVGLRKICKANSIPTPGLGYWRRKETGGKTSVPPLSDRGNWDKKICIRSYEMQPKTEPIEPKWKLKVPKTLSSPHRLTELTAKGFSKNKLKNKGFLGKSLKLVEIKGS